MLLFEHMLKIHPSKRQRQSKKLLQMEHMKVTPEEGRKSFFKHHLSRTEAFGMNAPIKPQRCATMSTSYCNSGSETLHNFFQFLKDQIELQQEYANMFIKYMSPPAGLRAALPFSDAAFPGKEFKEWASQ